MVTRIKLKSDEGRAAECFALQRAFRVIETDNYGRDYPNESFHGPVMTYCKASAVVDIFNASLGPNPDRWYRIVDQDYTLQPGFEP